MPGQIANTGGRLMLDINGENAAFVKKFSGFAMEADIVSNDLGPDNVQKKHVAKTRWTPARATIGIGMGKECYQWIKAAFEKGTSPGAGRSRWPTSTTKRCAVQTFRDALITSVTVPRLDGSSKDAAYFDVEFEAEQVRFSPGGGEVIGKAGPKQKPWRGSNFRVDMGGLPCGRVASVDSFTWKCAVASDDLGIFREPTRHPAKVTVPDIKLSISMADYAAWADAARKWFLDGQHLEDNEMQGSITFLDPNMTDEIGGIDLINCGFKKFSQDDFDGNSDKAARFNVELYVEKMKFRLNYLDAQ